MLQDPDALEIKQRCEKLIGAEIKINSNIKLNDKSTWCFKLSNKNIVGDSLEEIIYPYLKKYFINFKKGPAQNPPDFYNGKFEYEMKCYTRKPCFDLGSFNGFIKQLTAEGGVARKLYKTKYLIFEYHHEEDIIVINNFFMANLYEILNYNGKYPISIQVCDKIWKSVRPCSMKHRHRHEKSSHIFIERFCEAIHLCPNNFIENREEKIEIIKSQFEKLLGNAGGNTKKRKRSGSDDDEEMKIKKTKLG
jgi:hypothetical protein